VNSALQRALKHTALYQRAKASVVYRAYWKLIDPQIIHGIDAEVTFYRELLRGLARGGLILDVGANHRRKTGIFLALGARVIAIDPDELNQEILRQKYLSYRLERSPSQWSVKQ
jgi:hypothetical protein